MIDPVRAAGLVAIACGTPTSTQSMDEPEVVSLNAAVVTIEMSEGLQAFVGSYTFSGGEAERRALEDAVDKVVADMNPLVRGVARSRLLESNAIAGKVSIVAEGDRVTVGFDDRSYTAVLGGAAVEVTGVTGDRLQLKHRMKGKQLVQQFDGPRGSRRNVIGVRGEQLRIGVTVESESLPAPLVYTLTFSK